MCRHSLIFQIFLKGIGKNPHFSEGGNKISISEGGNVSALEIRTISSTGVVWILNGMALIFSNALVICFPHPLTPGDG